MAYCQSAAWEGHSILSEEKRCLRTIARISSITFTPFPYRENVLLASQLKIQSMERYVREQRLKLATGDNGCEAKSAMSHECRQRELKIYNVI